MSEPHRPELSSSFIRTVKLFKREGSSDKVYQLTMRPGERAGTFDLVFENARRGQALKLAKHVAGISREAAAEQFEKQLAAKKKDGYTEQEDGQAYSTPEFAGRDSGNRPQLPNVVPEGKLGVLLLDSRWVMQQKANGENRTLHFDGRSLKGANKKGLWVGIPQAWEEQLRRVTSAPLLLAGEHVGDRYYAFDALALDGSDLRPMGFWERYELLERRLQQWQLPDLELLPAMSTKEEKRRLLENLRARNEEGVVFKLREQPFQPGYTDAALKYKFVESSACQVIGVNERRSVRIGLLDAAGAIVPVGSVTVPPNQAVPQVGEVVEVEYLYYNPGGAFEQPVWMFKRNDMDPDECKLTQVTRYKPATRPADQDDTAEAHRPRMRA